MPNYKRLFSPGGTFFLTVVTHERRALLSEAANIDLLRNAIARVKQEKPFEIAAAVILPDHAHFLWRLPDGDIAYPARIGQMKLLFTKALQGEGSARASAISQSRSKHRESDVWQRRYWEHTIRDVNDFEMHLNYIHYNPVKHGYARCPHEWAHSSFSKWVGKSVYKNDWCCTCDNRNIEPPDFQNIARFLGE